MREIPAQSDRLPGCLELGALPIAEGEGVRSTLLQGTPEIHQKSSQISVLEIKRDMWGDLLKHQESPGITFDTTKLYKT